MERLSYRREIIEYSAGITIQDLKTKGLLSGNDLTANWSSALLRNNYFITNVFFTVTMKDGQGDITFQYNYKGQDYNFKQRIIRQPVYYGGYRYYFQCGCIKNGQYCGRRVKALYWGGNVYACRHCLELVYLACRRHRHYAEYLERAEALKLKADRYRLNKHPRKANRYLWTSLVYEIKATKLLKEMTVKLMDS